MENEKKIYQDNLITQSRYEFGLIEKRIIYLVIEKLREDYVISQNPKQTTSNLTLEMNFSKLKCVSSNITLVYNTIHNMIGKTFQFNEGERTIIVPLITKFIHDRELENCYVTVDEEIVKRFIDLGKKYTAYNLTVAMSLRSEYSQRFYEYCSQFRVMGGWKTKIEDLRFKLCLEEKYDRYANLKRYVIQTAYNELKTLYQKGECNLYFEYSEQKKGRSITGLTFKIIEKESSNETVKLEDLDYFVRVELHRLFDTENKPKNNAFVSKVMTTLRLEPEKFHLIEKKIVYTKEHIPQKEQTRYLRFIINEELLNNN